MERDCQIDFRNLPVEYVTEMFYSLAYDVDHYSGNNSYNGGCPICREGRSFGKKKRCWWLPDKGFIHCFNCGQTWNPVNFIKEAGNLTAADIARQIRSGEYEIMDLDKRRPVQLELSEEVRKALSFGDESLPEDAIDLGSESQLNYYKDSSAVQKALKYLESRRLLTAVNRPKTYFISLKDYVHRNRLVFPFYDERGRIVFYQTRAIGANVDEYREDIRYLGKVGAEKSVFNIDRVEDSIEEIFVFEGPIDSCFLKNGVAVAGISKGGSNFTELQESQLSLLRTLHKIVWVLDNQWVDETARVKSEKLLQEGESVFLWPEEYREYKDFNEYCVKNGVDGFPMEVVRKNTYRWGEAAKLFLLNMDFKKKNGGKFAMTRKMIELVNTF